MRGFGVWRPLCPCLIHSSPSDSTLFSSESLKVSHFKAITLLSDKLWISPPPPFLGLLFHLPGNLKNKIRQVKAPEKASLLRFPQTGCLRIQTIRDGCFTSGQIYSRVTFPIRINLGLLSLPSFRWENIFWKLLQPWMSELAKEEDGVLQMLCPRCFSLRLSSR